ncbi:transketolase family protein [Thermodesulfovibrionales bacterium]|nr:transketolase family protein [Thermodesulfovibrionales bacterium]MCL0030257.1 transketolase family protein [Thermodesulfovibrionales bacterium]MCL0035094.1 transketolase family protein [Thermodesulfovibrionales bacterium]MCL0046847.1 transketolase family protein [Thermodesulfovibrionales bacterium]
MGGRKQETEQKSQKTDFLGQAVATRNAYGIALLELGKRDGRIVVLDADLSGSTRTIEFANAFPDRFFNMGVSEQDMIGTAGGLSLTGKIPFASTFAVFETGRAWDQIRQTICYSNLNVKLVATHGGITVGEDGASHQALEDIALMRVLPNMTVIVPSDGFETKQVIDAVAEYDGPVYVRLGRGKVPAVMPEGYKFQIGKAYKFHAIHDTTIIANGIMVSLALKASEMLAKEGINAGVVNMSTVKPLDTDTLLEVAKNSKLIVTAEEHSIIGGLGSAVSEFLSENRAVLIKKVGVKDTFGCSGKPEELLKLYGLTADNIVKVVMESRA